MEILEHTIRTSSPDDLRNAKLRFIRPYSRAEEGYNNERKKTTNSTGKQGEGLTKKFACPFFKHDPIKYGAQDKRRCDCIGWTDISRLKEHLTRSHTQKTYCPRCYEEFPSLDGLYKHTGCTMRLGRPPDGITDDVLRKLRSRKKTSGPQSDHEKWVEIYRTLFPSRRHVPSPYFEKPQGTVLVRLEDHEEYMRKEFRRLLESRVEIKESGMDKEELKSILGECLDEALMGYRKETGLDFYDNPSSDRTSTAQIPEPLRSIYDPQTDTCYATDGTVLRDETKPHLMCEPCLPDNADCIFRSSAGDGTGRNICLSAENVPGSMMYGSQFGPPWTTWELGDDLHFNGESAVI